MSNKNPSVEERKRQRMEKFNKFSLLNRKLAFGDIFNEEDEILYFIPFPKFFIPKTKQSIKKGDWLDEFTDKAEPYKKYRISRELSDKKNVIYILPWQNVCEFEILKMMDFLQAFFTDFVEIKELKVEKLPKIRKKLKRRCAKGFGKQYFVPDIYNVCEKVVPVDSYCVVVISKSDIYHRDDWEYVFGKASMKRGVGVISYARFKGNEKKILDTILNVTVHEILHVMGFSHCIYYSCVMGGANDLDETRRRPLFLCPICLRKLKKFFPKLRFRNRFDKIICSLLRIGLKNRAEVLSKRLKEIDQWINKDKDEIKQVFEKNFQKK